MAAPPSTTAAPLEHDNWAVERALALPEVWGLVAELTPGLVTKWRLRDAGVQGGGSGGEGVAGTLPGLVVCGGRGGTGATNEVWRLDMATL